MQESILFYIFMNIYQLYPMQNSIFTFTWYTKQIISSLPIAPKNNGYIHCLGFLEGQNGKRKAPYDAALEKITLEFLG